MAEISRPWSGIVTGDAGPYSDDQWTDAWKTLLGPVIASQGVFQDQLNALVLGGLAASPITIDTGRALVNGIWYESDASVDVAIPTPAANPRVDRIVLRADWALQTVRITRIAGAEAAAPVAPALTQNDGVTWDLPMWQVFITVGGVISIWRDEREFIGQYVPTGLTEDRVYMEEEFFLPTLASLSNGDFLNSFLITLAANGAIATIPGFGAGGIGLTSGVAAAGNIADFASREHRPELINAHLIMRTKQPNSDAELDRIIGFASAVSLTPAHGVYFRANGAGNWFAVNRAAGVEAGTVTDTGQALDDVWRKFEIRQTGTDVVVFLIDDVVVATHQSNIPAADIALRGAIFDSGAASAPNTAYLDVDYYRLRGDR